MRVNESPFAWRPDLSLEAVRREVRPEADIVVRNGFPVPREAWTSTLAAEDDALVLIRRGERPAPGELRALLHARHTPGVAEALARAEAGIAGAGGLGSHVAEALARSGVGRLRIADFDVVEPSNLNRQLYAVEDIGRYKVSVLAERLARIAPLTTVRAEILRLDAASAPAFFEGCDVVIECFDVPEEKRLLVETLRLRLPGTPLVAASGLAGLGESNAIRSRRAGKGLVLVGDETSEARPGRGLMAPRVMIAAGHQANEALRLLLHEREA